MVERPAPQAGDVVWLDFAPQAGHEQSGRRPAVVLSPAAYNAKTGLAVCVPVTRRIKGYPFEVHVQVGSLGGVALADQVKSLDWRARRAETVAQLPPAQLAQIRALLAALLGINSN
ncbi:MAG: endoribonuclease MazF [Rhodocyclaceae bacterium]|nr:endoribonuclease MazF [Rhodocyclaceae bacterium]